MSNDSREGPAGSHERAAGARPAEAAGGIGPSPTEPPGGAAAPARSRLVREAAAALGFDRCGIAPAAAIPRGDYLANWLATGRAGTMAYLHRHVDSRRDVRAWLPWARSVVVVALNYQRRSPERPEDHPRGRVARYAWGEDYHAVLREKMERLVARMEERLAVSFRSRVCVDTSAIVERELAAAAGIGWIGKNTMVIHPRLGSFFFLGEIITDLALEPGAPEPDHCGTCTRCLDACPTRAFPRAYEMDARRCISYLTIEHRGEIDPALAPDMGDWVFGCDVCQTVCPFNAAAPETTEPRFRDPAGAERPPDPGAAFPVLDEITAWDETAYHRAVRDKATKRAKLHMWHRNARIARRNATSGRDF